MLEVLLNVGLSTAANAQVDAGGTDYRVREHAIFLRGYR